MSLRLLVGLATLASCGRVGIDPRETDAMAADAVTLDDSRSLPLCDRVGAQLLCTDFESGVPAGVEQTGGAPTIDGYEGAGYTFTAEAGDDRVLRLPVTAGAGSTLHIGGRAFVEVGATSDSYVVLAQAMSADFSKISFDYESQDRLQLVNSTYSGGAGIQTGVGVLPRGRWFCFELAIVIAAPGAGGRAELFVDGASTLLGWTNENTVPATGYDRVELGAVSSSGNTQSTTIRYDNWIVGTAPIGCP